MIKEPFFNNTIMRSFLKLLKTNFYKRKWRSNNKHNRTIIKFCSNISSLKVGSYSYGEINAVISGNIYKISIGHFVSIAPNVMFILDSEHNINTLSSFPFKVMILNHKREAFGKGDIVVDDDVWIGYGSTILSGVHIGQGAIIAAGSVVTSNIPPYAVVGGVPAKVIKYRFNQKIIDYMLTLDYGALTEELIKLHIDDLYSKIDGYDIRTIHDKFKWFPKKSI